MRAIATFFYFFLLFVLQLPITCSAQNLVPNPSFEDVKKLPSCYLHLPKDTFSSYIYDWYMPTNGSSDIFSTLLPPQCISSANTTYGRVNYFPVSPHQPRTGNNFAGIAINEWYREYLGVKLSSPLIPGEAYCCEMYVSFNPSSQFAHQCLGMYFSDNILEKDDFTNLYLTPQITVDSVITDSINWIRIGTVFKATSAANYLTIGDFCSLGATQYIPVGTQTNDKYDGTYYFIDDISVSKIEFIKPIITGNKSVCPGDSLKLKATGWDNIQWYYNNSTFPLNQANSNEINIKANLENNELIIRGTICDWPVQESLFINFLPIPSFNLGNDTLICQGSSLILDPGNGLQNFTWQDGSTNSTFSASQEGFYKVTAANSDGCINKDSITIGYYKNPSINLGDDIEQCNPSGTLNVLTQQKEDTYLWQDNSTKPQINYTKEGEYYVSVENPCGIKDRDTIIVHKIESFIPNLITPNQDSLNDKFIITGTLEGKGSLNIFNRSGSKVYENKNYKNTWPEKDLTEEVYYYIYSYPNCEDKKGWVQLIK